MILGKWNKSVIMSYVGLMFSLLGMFFFIENNIKTGLVCLMMAGICDMFDGTIARRCKRNKEEKLFGIQLDSLVDVFSFIALPVVFFYKIGFNKWYFLPILGIYAIYGIARLAYFNIKVENNNLPVKYYQGLPVTFIALILPLVYLLSYVLSLNIFLAIMAFAVVVVAISFIIDIKIAKPKLKTSIILLLLAIVVSIIYLFVL